MTKYLTWALAISLLLVHTVAYSQGLAPSNYDGFETGDYRNFLPKYAGESDAFVRPRFSVAETAPIAGGYSLRWAGDKEDEHRWLLTSNAFYLRPPLTARFDFRLDAPLVAPNSGVGLMILETYEKLTGVWARSEGVELVLDSVAGGEVADRRDLDARLTPGTVYTLAVSIDGDGVMHARLCETESGRTLAELCGATIVHPHGLALAVDEPAGVAVQVAIDNVRVEAAPYRVRAETWTRAPLPYFVTLPRQGDVPQAEGNWVGAHGLFRDDHGYHMWYRIRNNEIRGAGYGYAFSEDGLTWKKSDRNPLFIPDPQLFASNEKITVRKIDGKFRAWYTIDHREKQGWYTVHASSNDGLEWEDHRIVIEEPRSKDADVVYVDGTYYLYAISPDDTSFGVFTSDDGLEWEMRNVIPMRIHRHPSIYYDRETAKFWLYASCSHLGMHRAWSTNGIEFSDFEYVWSEPPVGIDDWREGGIDYAQFRTNPHGHLLDTHRNLIMIYQGRNTKANNHPSWLYHGSERILMAGYFSGLHVGIPTHVAPDRPYEYERFPYDATAADGLSVQASSPGRAVVTDWSPDKPTVLAMEIRGRRGDRWRLELRDALEPGTIYELAVQHEDEDRWQTIERNRAGSFGDNVFIVHLPRSGPQAIVIRRVD
ncbi:MAG: hypothetical protein GXY44_02275 [Phycisphaerales bacterium]|nr:hypothetical protein [Phycisphaerales bacterium]